MLEKCIRVLRIDSCQISQSLIQEHPASFAPIAQLDRVTDYESVGRRFESCWARH